MESCMDLFTCKNESSRAIISNVFANAHEFLAQWNP
jgi:hypothetical protein